jgi:hypothetical protein
MLRRLGSYRRGGWRGRDRWCRRRSETQSVRIARGGRYSDQQQQRDISEYAHLKSPPRRSIEVAASRSRVVIGLDVSERCTKLLTLLRIDVQYYKMYNLVQVRMEVLFQGLRRKAADGGLGMSSRASK